MGKRITDYKSVNILLAILIAVALWVYVTTVVDPNDQKTLRDMPITLIGEDVLNSKGLMLDPSIDLTLDLTLTGNRNTLVRETGANSTIAVTADVANISAAGEYTLPLKVSTPGTISVDNGNNYTIKVLVIKMLSKTVEVRGTIAGSVPEGYRTNDFTLSPAAVTIRGPENVVNQVEYVQVTVSGTDRTKTFTGDLGFSYVTAEGELLDDAQITSNVDTINVILPVVKTLEVPLTVEFANGGGATEDDVTFEITPSTIQVSGEEADITALQDRSISLGIIDLSKVTDTSDPLRFHIDLAPELTNDSGITEAEVKVKILGLTTRVFETSNIEVVNAPEGYIATPVTQSLQVQVRGTEEALEDIYDNKLRVVVDLKFQDFSPGQYRQDAKVYLDASGQVGVVGDNKVVISVAPKT